MIREWPKTMFIHASRRASASPYSQINGGVNEMGSLPPPSSIPGLGVLAGGGASWTGSMGKKLGELRDSPTYMFLPLFDWTLLLSETAV